jgi:hypothetical protein
LDQQRATAEILKIISCSLPDVQPVFNTIVCNTARLCGTDDVVLQRVDGDASSSPPISGRSRPTSPDADTPDLVVGRAVGLKGGS